jgi:diacylglycerol kinase family enzyme
MLIANPRAGSVSARVRDVIVRALQADFKLEHHTTARRDHAMELSADAVDRDLDAVLAFGGDGTINEVAQPLVGTGVALGILPGGSTNVMARSLGMPTDPVEATAFVAEHLRNDTRRRIGVGSLAVPGGQDEPRYFLFSAGIGLDAEVVKRVEAHQARTGAKGEWTFIRHALAAGVTEYRGADPWLTVEAPAEEPYRAVLAICCNAWPFTYLGSRPVNACPEARLEKRLDLIAFGRIRGPMIPGIIRSVLSKGRHARWKHTHYWHDVPQLRLTADAPKPLQVDGDYIGEWTDVELRHERDALDLLV